MTRHKTLSARPISGLLLVTALAALTACGGSDDAPLALPACPAAVNTLRDITAVQGAGNLSPYVNTLDALVTVRGVVTADFQATEEMNGFFIQQPVADNDPSTSEGLFIYAPSSAAVNVGDYVQVSGTVAEFQSGSSSAERLTELSDVTEVSVCGAGPAIAARVLTLPVASAAEFEAVEGMLVEFQQTLTVSEAFGLGRYGELLISAGGRLFQPNNHPSTLTPAEIISANARASIVLDDGRTSQNPNPIPYLSAADTSGTRRVGDTLSSLRGVMTWGADAYRVHPVVAPTFVAANARATAPSDVGGTLKAGSLNVLNYFTTLNQRGANSAAEFIRQRDKLVQTIAGLNADALGLMEIENNGTVAVADLVAAINAHMGAGTYAHVDSGIPGTDAIKVTVIYKPARLRPIGNPVVPTDAGFAVDGGMRPPMAQRFAAISNNGSFWMVVNHLKSKGSCPSGASDPNQDSGQGCWNAARTVQATTLASWVGGLVTSSGETDVLMMGDFNAYLNEDPIKTLETAGHEDLLKRLPAAERYTYVFSGESGALDHAFASASLGAQVNGLTVWHVNADEPPVFDYNTEFKTDDRYAATPYRSSDHDPVLVGLTLNADAVVTVPALAATLPTSGTTGAAVAISGITATDGTALSVDWGDGSQETLDIAATGASHTYASAGTYALVLHLAGSGGTSAERTGNVVISAPPPTGNTPELFFSEYVEGSSNNKALEIYNPTGAAVDLSAYTVKLYSNGSATAGTTHALSGSLAAGQTLVLLNASFTTTKVVPGSIASGATNYNGDDAVTLEKSGGVVDAIGQVGFDPGTAWVTGSSFSTVNKTLRRKAGIVHGSVPAAAPAAWDISIEWNVYDQDNFDDLGLHTP
jgi:predicted extracellular nuclease